MGLATTIDQPAAAANDTDLQVYLLGQVEYETALALQRRLVYDVAGDRAQQALIICEHPATISVGRQGSWRHIRWDIDELRYRGWPIRWVNRGGGAMLHLPGQLAIYPILPLDQLGLGVQAYINHLQDAVLELLADFTVRGHCRPGHAGVWVQQRLLASVGVAVRNWVSYHGLWINICPDLEYFRAVRSGPNDLPMTSLARERRGLVHMALIRQRFLEHFSERFGFGRTTLFFEHPLLGAEKGESRFRAASQCCSKGLG